MCGEELMMQVQEGWSGWRQVSGEISDKRAAGKGEGKVYKRVMRPKMLSGLETVTEKCARREVTAVDELLHMVHVACRSLFTAAGKKLCFSLLLQVPMALRGSWVGSRMFVVHQGRRLE